LLALPEASGAEPWPVAIVNRLPIHPQGRGIILKQFIFRGMTEGK
jgi:hypothetical protein